MKRFSAASTITLLLLALVANPALSAETDAKRISLDLKKVPFPEVVRSILSGSGSSYWVAPTLNDLRVSATLKNVTRDQAIRVVTKTAGVVYTVFDDTYFFKPAPGTSVPKTPGQIHTPAAPRGPAGIEIVSLRYVSAGDAASLLNASPPDGLESVTATNVNTLMIKGDAESLRQAKELIKLFDVESALPRSARIVLSLKFEATGMKEPVSLAAESVGPEGTPMPLSISYGSKERGSYMLSVTLTPTVLPGGSVSLTGSGAIDCSDYNNGAPGTERVSRAFEVAASVIPGKPTVIASGSAEAGEAKMGFSASATVTIEQGRLVIPTGGLSTPGAAPAALPRSSHQLVSAVSKPDESHREAADALLQQIWDAQPGQPKFDAIDAVVREYKESDLAARNAIAWLCMTYMRDESRDPLSRWPCEYVLSYAGFEPAVPDLIDLLLHDRLECMRAVAAEALGGWWKSTGNSAMHDALVQASKMDASKWVRDTIARYMGTEVQ